MRCFLLLASSYLHCSLQPVSAPIIHGLHRQLSQMLRPSPAWLVVVVVEVEVVVVVGYKARSCLVVSGSCVVVVEDV